jgi:hypothetical protein
MGNWSFADRQILPKEGDDQSRRLNGGYKSWTRGTPSCSHFAHLWAESLLTPSISIVHWRGVWQYIALDILYISYHIDDSKSDPGYIVEGVGACLDGLFSRLIRTWLMLA